ncbi:MAG: 2-amino-4-hydroxy-6-hydroxymethyldihydropteridine diphosphokinase, partial [Planctomycetales bacterium 12-60-4]
MDRCWIGLGGNLGNVPETFAAVAAVLRRRNDISDLTVSPLYRSAPMGVNAGDEFWNAVVGLETRLDPRALLELLQQLELRHGRVRSVAWGPRTLDLDVIYFGDRLLDTPELKLPHPGRICRRFVLDPLCDLAPQGIDPEYGLTVSEIRERLLRAPRRLILPLGLN